MKNHKTEFNIERIAKILKVLRQGYYGYLERKPSKRKQENQRLLEKIQAVHTSSRKIYGSPRVHIELKKEGEKCSRKRVARIMRKEGIQAKTRKKWKKTTKNNPKAIPAPTHLNQNFSVEEKNKVWVSDITYIETGEGWLYLAVTLDFFS